MDIKVTDDTEHTDVTVQYHALCPHRYAGCADKKGEDKEVCEKQADEACAKNNKEVVLKDVDIDGKIKDVKDIIYKEAKKGAFGDKADAEKFELANQFISCSVEVNDRSFVDQCWLEEGEFNHPLLTLNLKN